MPDSPQPALHPERIRATLRSLKASGIDGVALTSVEIDTCRAALELVRKGQLAVGLTGDVADAGKAALQLLATIQKIGSGR